MSVMFFVFFVIQLKAKANEQVVHQPVYFLAQVKITDKDKFFKEYAPKVSKLIKSNGGKVLFRGLKPKVQLEGSWNYFTIAVEFPSRKQFDEFYFSNENLTGAVPIRLEASSSNNLMLF